MLSLLATLLFAKAAPSVAFYYGDDPSADFFEQFDRVVVDPDRIDPIWPRRYPDKLFAYVSIGEHEAWRGDTPKGKAWKLGKNRAWNSEVADLTDPGYRAFVLQRFATLHARGYRNFFLDTLDAVFGKVHDAKAREAQKAALSTLLAAIRTHYPDAKLIANRGVEVMEQLCRTVDAFAIESLYKGIDAKTKAYIDLPEHDSAWIRTQLDRAKACGLQPIVIDYLPEDAAKARAEDARKITEAGYTPYITDRYLQHYGRGTETPVRREVLLLYDSAALKDGDKVYANAHLMSSMPLEYLGYIPVLKDIRDGLPYGGIDRYAGIVIWPDGYYHDQQKLFAWVAARIREGQKLLFLNDFGFEMTPERAKALGLRTEPAPTRTLFARTVSHAPMAGYEIPARAEEVTTRLYAPRARVLLHAQDDANRTFDAAAITSWGGYAVYDSAQKDIEKEPLWRIDPFALFSKALDLQPLPVPDPTTENGRRILFVHIDGDGFIEKVRFDPEKYAAQTLYDQILTRYPIPHSVSIIEGEIGPEGLYPKRSPKMESIARKIFRLPHVEIASHSYSHPFKWQALEEERKHARKQSEAGYHLPIPGYRFDLSREINGSVGYIDRRLAPPGKRCRLFFWTGDCLPRSDALRMSESMGLAAINGGDTTVTDANPWLGRIAPFGLQRGAFWQIYVGEQNENIYTNDWTGPFWGYRHAIETFERTEHPIRCKPIDIYYHFYSASRSASLDALKKVYDYAMRQSVTPLYTSEYIAIAQDFYRTAITRIPGGYRIRNRGDLRTIRLPESLGYPDIAASSGVVGYKEAQGYRYLHLDGSGDYRLILRHSRPVLPCLIEANGRVKSYRKREKRIRISLQSHVAVKARFYLPKGWRIAGSHPKAQCDSRRICRINSTEKALEITFVPR